MKKEIKEFIIDSCKYLVFYTLGHIYLQKTFRLINVRYKQAPKKAIAAFHSIICSARGLKIIQSDWSTKNLIHSTHPDTSSAMSLEFSYLLFDLLLDLQSGVKYPILIHHVLFMMIVILRLQIPKGDYFLASGLMMNASTPFLQLSWYFYKAGIKSKLVDFLLLVSFVFCRFYVFGRCFWLHGRRLNKSMLQVFNEIPIKCRIGTCGIIALNSVWTIGLFKRFIKKVK